MHPRDLVTSLISSLQTPDQQSTLSASSNPLLDAPAEIQKALLTLHVLFPNELLPALDLLDRNLITRLTLPHQDEAQHDPPNPAPLPGSLPRANDSARAQSQPRHLRHLPILQHPPEPPGESAQQMPAPQTPAPTPQPQSLQRHVVQDLGRQDPSLPHQQPEAGNPPLAPHARHAQVYVVRSGQLPSRVRAVSRDAPRPMASYEVRLDAWSCSCPAFAFAAFPAVVAGQEDPSEDSTHQLTDDFTIHGWRFGGLTVGSDLPVCKHLLACLLIERSSLFAAFVEDREVSVEELAGWAAGWED